MCQEFRGVAGTASYQDPDHKRGTTTGGDKVESRRATRLRAQVATHVGFIRSEIKFTASLLDFSPFGLSVKASREVTTGTIFRLGIQVGSDCFRAAAIVRAIIPGGFGVEFLSMTPLDREMMRRFYLRLQMAARAG